MKPETISQKTPIKNHENQNSPSFLRPGRHPSLFRRWLVSDPAGGRDLGMVLASAPGNVTKMVSVVGGADSANRVEAPKLSVSDHSAVTGAIAWWIGDESQKARLNLHERQAVDKPQAAQMVASHDLEDFRRPARTLCAVPTQPLNFTPLPDGR